MKIVVFGATGPTGRQVVVRALELGHVVTAFVRNPNGLDLRDPGLTVVQGDVFDLDAVEAAVRGQDAVISALGPRNRTTRSSAPVKTLESDGVRNVLTAMKTHGVRRLIVTSSVGVGATKGRGGFLLEWVLRPFYLRDVFDDKDRMEELVRASDVDWVIVQPTKLTDRPARGRIVVDEEPVVPWSIGRADVARFLVDQTTDDRWLRRAPLIGG